ncbi:MAG: metallophosphoesterase family protein [Planctomycetaceae bacterium]
MRILHTADWHLGDRLGRIDRTDDLRRGVERIADYCQGEAVDLLLVAGDLFSDLSRPDALRESIAHLQGVFLPFLRRGGTIVALTGNHDNETFCQTLRHALTLAAPDGLNGAPGRGGRLYLATGPSVRTIAGHDGRPVQFVLMPYPTAGRYLDDQAGRSEGPAERPRAVQAAYAARLRQLREGPHFRPDLPTVLAAHIHVEGARFPGAFRMDARESLVFPADHIPDDWAYVALGHIHQPQALGGKPHVRYSGSIDRLDLGEKGDLKSAVLIDVGPEGLREPPALLPLDATPIYEVVLTRPEEELPNLRAMYPDSDRALVRYHLTYRPGVDNLLAIQDELDRIFPRWYDRDWHEAGASTPTGPWPVEVAPPTHRGVRETVMDYLSAELADHDDRQAVLELAGALLAEEDLA